MILVYLINNAIAADWPDCGFRCNAGDVDVEEIWLGDAQGNVLHPCDSELQMTVYLWARFQNNANAPRYAVILLGDIYVNGALQKSFYDQGLCVLDSIPPKTSSSAPLCSFFWSCGQDVTIKRFILSWETSKKAGCSDANRECRNRGTKCYGGFDTEIHPITPPTCLISGLNIACESITAIYTPEIKGNPVSNYRFAWRIDGSDVKATSDDGSISIVWKKYGGGYHILQLIVSWVDESGKVWATSTCDMRVMVVKVPSADIERD
ncbi:MAG: hypothetical protein ACE14P_00260 [Methanotrichaceae archaeon]